LVLGCESFGLKTGLPFVGIVSEPGSNDRRKIGFPVFRKSDVSKDVLSNDDLIGSCCVAFVLVNDLPCFSCVVATLGELTLNRLLAFVTGIGESTFFGIGGAALCGIFGATGSSSYSGSAGH